VPYQVALLKYRAMASKLLKWSCVSTSLCDDGGSRALYGIRKTQVVMVHSELGTRKQQELYIMHNGEGFRGFMAGVQDLHIVQLENEPYDRA